MHGSSTEPSSSTACGVSSFSLPRRRSIRPAILRALDEARGVALNRAVQRSRLRPHDLPAHLHLARDGLRCGNDVR